MLQASSAQSVLLRQIAQRLSADGRLSQAHCAAIEQLPGEPTAHRRGADITQVLNKGPQFIVAGWACEMRPLAKGGRQIFRFMLPGDAIGSFWPRLSPATCQTMALTRLELLAAAALMASDSAGVLIHGAIVEAARREEDHTQVLLFDHMVRLGARDAYCGLSHLLLELHERLGRVGLVDGDSFLLPLGQRVLAQTMGVSLAHLNHTLQRMQADGLIDAKGPTMRLLQPERMMAISDFAHRG